MPIYGASEIGLPFLGVSILRMTELLGQIPGLQGVLRISASVS